MCGMLRGSRLTRYDAVDQQGVGHGEGMTAPRGLALIASVVRPRKGSAKNCRTNGY